MVLRISMGVLNVALVIQAQLSKEKQSSIYDNVLVSQIAMLV